MAKLSAIGEAARTRGELVYGYQQGDEDYNYKDIGPWGAVRNGYCAALGFKWIKLRLGGGDLVYDVKTRMAEKDDWRITRLHNLTKDVGGYDKVLAEFGLKRNGPVAFGGAPNAMQICTKVAADPGCYMVQYKRQGGGHLVAMQNEPKGLHYFDANFGHFVFKGLGRFQNWYSAFLTQSGYAQRYTVQTIVTSVVWSDSNTVSNLRKRFGG
jgi:Yersinia/Haemophilus virulence surface antigen